MVAYLGVAEMAGVIADARPACERAVEFVRVHASQLPTTLDGIRAFPPSFRPYLFERLTDDQKSEFWRTHLSRYVGQHRNTLSGAQLQYLEESYAYLEPTVFANVEQERSNRNHFKMQAIDLFGKGGAYELGVYVGDQTVAGANLVSAQATAVEWVIETSREISAQFETFATTCTCSQIDDWCSPYPTSPTMTCVQPEERCTMTSSGCGWWTAEACTGNCRP
ncbi:MAG TPA: bacteriocin fulvocin C-related protein [Vicinamibacterales bacterium]|nr:bacteriocin fulvocin C-related protein [Vicinamibacterales bacterium]